MALDASFTTTIVYTSGERAGNGSYRTQEKRSFDRAWRMLE
jgi:hypothetical protein